MLYNPPIPCILLEDLLVDQYEVKSFLDPVVYVDYPIGTQRILQPGAYLHVWLMNRIAMRSDLIDAHTILDATKD